jgi:tripartite-type tricarboxylate transporter receptor subunit TctC
MFRFVKGAGFLSAALLSAVLPQHAGAQDYPNRPIKFVVTYAPSVVTDIVARIVAPEMSKILGQPIVVENKPGADTVIGFDYVARANPADGYTVVVTLVPGLATLPLLNKDLRFDAIAGLPPFIDLTESRLVFASSTKFGWKTMQELLNAARANPGKLNYGVSSSLTRIMTDGFVKDFKIDAVPVPFTGGGPWQVALLAGTVEMGFTAEGASIGQAEKLNILAVTGETRSRHFPAAPTFKELGFPDYKGLAISLNVRAGTPQQAIDKLYAAAAQAMKMADVKTRLQGAGFEPISDSTPESAARRLADQSRFFAQIAKANAAAPTK